MGIRVPVMCEGTQVPKASTNDTNRRQLFLFCMRNRMLGPSLAAVR
jgi:hypothetical protein